MLQRSVSPVSFFHPISVYLSSFLCKNHIFIVTTTNIQEVSPIQRAMLLVPVHHYRHTHYLYVDRQTDNPVLLALRHTGCAFTTGRIIYLGPQTALYCQL